MSDPKGMDIFHQAVRQLDDLSANSPPSDMPDGYVLVRLTETMGLFGNSSLGCMCERCGALVGSSTKHDEFHNQKAGS